jgi:hypothetical protein
MRISEVEKIAGTYLISLIKKIISFEIFSIKEKTRRQSYSPGFLMDVSTGSLRKCFRVSCLDLKKRFF